MAVNIVVPVLLVVAGVAGFTSYMEFTHSDPKAAKWISLFAACASALAVILLIVAA